MRVLEPGRKQKGWAIEHFCTGDGNGKGGCGARLLIEQGDLFKTSSNSRDEREDFATFKCEACGVRTDVKQEIVPAWLWGTLPSYEDWKKTRDADD